ncbi:MAG: ADP-heptose synthase [Proteobacteria bacterium SG_bin7]|nr:MAG: ADP-heptose synthase [Proteobacteria bacterium SG_bin7]
MIRKMAEDVLRRLELIKNKKILVVGDVGVDEYVIGDVNRISPEAPVPVLDVTEESLRLGLSANVAQNIASLFSQPILLSVVGNDPAADQLRNLLKKEKVDDSGLIVDNSRPTTRKLRVMAQHHHIVRVDFEHRKFLNSVAEKDLLQRAADLIPKVDGVILQDYAKGIFSENVAQKLIKMAREKEKKVLVDPHRTTPLRYYRGADLIKPNFQEALALAKMTEDDLHVNKNLLPEVVRVITEQGNFGRVVVTRGKHGMTIYENGQLAQVPTFAREVFDVTGAGDTVIASLALGWVSGFNLAEAALLANAAAGVVVAKIGCVPCHFDEAQTALQNLKNFQENA